MNEQFITKVRESIISHLDIEEDLLADFDNDTILFNTGDDRPNLGLDSIDSLELVRMIFEVFGYDVPVEDIKNLYSVNAVAAYLNEKGINE